MKIYAAILALGIVSFPHTTLAETVSIDPPSEPVVVASPAVAITLTPDRASVGRGQMVTYTLTIANHGDAPFTNLSATFGLPAGFIFTGGTSPSALKKLGTLPASETTTKTFTLQVGDAASAGRVPLEMLIDADEFDLNETIAIVEVKTGEVLGAETLVDTGTSALPIIILGIGSIAAGYILRRHYV